ncbi:MAG: transglutaminase-like domain-containing protein [Candidatus Nealsonbacteria bacterium]
MNQKIKTQKGFIQTPLLIGIIVSIIVATGIGYGAIEYNKTSKIIREAEQLTKEEKYDEAIAKLELVQNKLFGKMIFKQNISTKLDTNKKLLEDQSEYTQGIEEFNQGKWEAAKDLLSKVSEVSPYYQDAKSKIEEAQNKITEEQVAEAVNKAKEEAQVEKQITQEEITKLQLEKQKAEEQWIETDKERAIEGILRIGNTLQDYYNKIRDAKALGALWCLYGSQCEVNFWADLAKHSLGTPYTSWPDYESNYHTLTGSYSYLDAKKQLDNILFVTYATGVDYYKDSDYEKIRKILDFINFHIHYESDMDEIPRAPAETLGLKSGDCEDHSILLSAALADAGINSAVMLVKSIDGTQAHAIALVQSKETLPLYYYSDLTQYGLPSGRWWIIEPQYPFEKQPQHPEWFAKWRIVAVASVEVASGERVYERTFSFEPYPRGASRTLTIQIPVSTYDYYRSLSPTPLYGDLSKLSETIVIDSTITYIVSEVRSKVIGGDEKLANALLTFCHSILKDEEIDHENPMKYPIEILVEGSINCVERAQICGALMYEAGFDAVFIAWKQPDREYMGHVVVGVHLTNLPKYSYDKPPNYCAYESKLYYIADGTGHGYVGDLRDDLVAGGWHERLYDTVPVK